MKLTPKFSPLTWLDVERRFKEATANYTHFTPSIQNIHCFYDGAEIEFSGKEIEAREWVKIALDQNSLNAGDSIILQIGMQNYPIRYSKTVSTSTLKTPTYPLWKELAYLEQDADIEFPTDWNNGPDVIAFHSFKGGVGRTTSLMTYASGYLNQEGTNNLRILLVDADLEAPGISFWLGEENPPTVSFTQLLEALHYPPVDIDNTLDYFSAELKKTSLNIGGANREVFILPAAMNLGAIMDIQVTPENLARNLNNPWILSDSLQQLGIKLDVDIVMIDLRAGLSELASPLLFDPRVEHFFVTTVAPQSISGMAEVLSRLYSFQKHLPESKRRSAKPSVVLNMLTSQLKQLDVYTSAIQKLNAAYPPTEDDFVSQGIDWIESDFADWLMSIKSVRQAFELLPRAPLYSTAETWAKKFNALSSPLILNQEAIDINAPAISDASKLFETCEKFQFAERATTDDMLVTDPLRNLAKHFANELPNIVSVGAKGAGKTFTFLQICRTKTWRSFLEKLGQGTPTLIGGLIYPLLVSTNVENDSLEVTKAARRECESKLGFSTPTGVKSINSRITEALRSSVTNWDIFWEQVILEEFGFENQTLEAMNQWLSLSDNSLVLLIDGIEDIFDSPEDDEIQRAAIKALLQLPNRLNQLEYRKIGLICFARADYVQAVIRQNLAQYLSRFQAFRLEWTPESFLRLAYWICGKAKIINADPDAADKQTTERLITSLEKLWGKKMGGDSSKEANTARWVFAALCDLNGRLQARDLVRFLKIAAKLTVKDQNSFWADRVLTPEAIRKSLPECSNEKIKEAASEIRVLQQWQEILESVPSENKKVPFNATAVGLSNERLVVLRELGIVYEDGDQLDEPNRFYLPEIYRWGLGFQSSAGGRPRVQALLKRNLGKLPF